MCARGMAQVKKRAADEKEPPPGKDLADFYMEEQDSYSYEVDETSPGKRTKALIGKHWEPAVCCGLGSE